MAGSSLGTVVPWQHVRQMPPPLQAMPNMWMPHLNEVNPYHSSGCDIVQAGWRKWNPIAKDMYAMSAVPTEPDWFSRRVRDTRLADLKSIGHQYDLYQRPTQRGMYGQTATTGAYQFEEDPVFGSGLEKTLAAEPARAHRTQPHTNGIDEVTVKPHAISGDLKPYYHGRYSPRAYYQPTRIEPFCDSAKTMPSRPVP